MIPKYILISVFLAWTAIKPSAAFGDEVENLIALEDERPPQVGGPTVRPPQSPLPSSELQTLLSDIRGNTHSFTTPRRFDGVKDQLSGVVVQDMPTHACQQLLLDLERDGRLTPPVALETLIAPPKFGGVSLQQQINNLLDLQKSVLTASERDLRGLLIKELRQLLTETDTSTRKMLLGFRKAEAAARLKQTTLLLERLGALGAKYEEELIRSLKRSSSSGGSSSSSRTITKLFVSNIAQEVEAWLAGPTFFSPQLQQLLLLMLQLEQQDIPMPRDILFQALDAYMQQPQQTKQEVMKIFVGQLNTSKLLLADEEISLIIDMLVLLWEAYFSHNADVLNALKAKDRVGGTSGLEWLEKEVKEGREAVLSCNKKRNLDKFGFLSAFYLFMWMQESAVSALSLILPCCRLLHLSGSAPLSLVSSTNFAVSVEYYSLSAQHETREHKYTQQLTNRADKYSHYIHTPVVALATSPFSVSDFVQLQRHAASPLRLKRRVEVLQLTATTANTLRQILTVQGTPARDIGELLGAPPASPDTVDAAVSRLFEGIFTGERKELRDLFNGELGLIEKRMQQRQEQQQQQRGKQGQRKQQQRQQQELQELEDLFSSLSDELIQLLMAWVDALKKEKAAVVSDMQQQMEAAAADPNLSIDSLFFNSNIAENVVSSISYTTTYNASAVSSISAVQQMKKPSWVVQLNVETLKKAQAAVLLQPSMHLTHQAALRNRIFVAAGKQRVLRRDILQRIATVLQLTARLQYNFYDARAALLSPLLREQLKQLLQQTVQRRPSLIPADDTAAAAADSSDAAAGEPAASTAGTETAAAAAAGDGRAAAAAAAADELLDTLGFATAVKLFSFAQQTKINIQLLDGKNRIISVATPRKNAPLVAIIEDPTNGAFLRVAANEDVRKMLQSIRSIKERLHLPSLRLTEASSPPLPAPTPPLGFLKTLRRLFKGYLGKDTDVSGFVSTPLTDAVATALEKSCTTALAAAAAAVNACYPTSTQFVRCMVAQVLSCYRPEGSCVMQVNKIENMNTEILEKAFIDLHNLLEDETEFFSKYPWNRIKHFSRDALDANQEYLSRDERELIFNSFLSGETFPSPFNLRGIHILLMRSILFNISPSNPGAACITAILRGEETTKNKKCVAAISQTFSPFLRPPKLDDEGESILMKAAERAAAQLRSIQILDSVSPSRIAEELRRLLEFDFSTFYDFLLAPMEDSSSSPEEKIALGACFFQLGRQIDAEKQMYSHVNGLLVRSDISTLIKRCFVDTWSRRMQLMSEESEAGAATAAGAAGAAGEEAAAGDAVAAADDDEARRASMITTADEALRRAMLKDLFLQSIMQHRMRAVLQALDIFLQAEAARRRKGKEGRAAIKALVQRMRSLSFSRFSQFVMASPQTISFSLSIIAQELKKDMFLIYKIPYFSTALFLRIGNPSRSVATIMRKFRRQNLICNPICRDVQRAYDMETKIKRKIARSLSSQIRLQVASLKRICKSMAVMGAVRSGELLNSFKILELMGKKPESVSPGSLDICSLHLRGLAASALPVCSYESIPFRYALEAFRISLAQRGVHASTWFRFFSMNDEAIVQNSIVEAKRITSKKSLEEFTKSPEWRRVLPLALDNAATALLDRFADLKSLIYLLEGRVDTRGFRRGVRSLTHKILQWLMKPKEEKKIIRRAGPSRSEEVEIETQDTINLSDLSLLSEEVIITGWRNYSFSIDSMNKEATHFNKTHRLLAAVGTGFRCNQMFLSDQKAFFGEIKGNKTAEEILQRTAGEFFVSPGAVPDGFRSLRAEATLSIQSYCRGKANICKVDQYTPQQEKHRIPDTCTRPTVFCTQAMACAEASDKEKRIVLDSDCLLRLLDELLTSASPLVPVEVVLSSLSRVLSQFPFSIILWNQLNGTLTQFKQKYEALDDSIPIQIIIAPRSTPKAEVSMLSSSFIQEQEESTTKEGKERASKQNEGKEEREEDEDVFYSATAADESSETTAETKGEAETEIKEETAATMRRVTEVEEETETELFIVSPGFDLYERLMEARRAVNNEPSLPFIPHGGSFFTLERTLVEMQERLSQLSTKRADFDMSLQQMQQIVNDISGRQDLDRDILLKQSKIFESLGPSKDNQKFFTQQKYTIESLLAETDIDASLFDFHLLRSLTVLQLFVACSEIPTDCNSFKTEFFSSVKVTLLKAKEEGAAHIRLGQQQQRRLDSFNKLQQGIEQLEPLLTGTTFCLTEGCREEAEAAVKLFKPIQSLLGDQRYRQLKREALMQPAAQFSASVPLQPFIKASHLTLPFVPMQQWLSVLRSVRTSPALLTAKSVVMRSIASIEVTCFEIARTRLKSALMVIQKAAEQMVPGAAGDIARASAERQRKQDQAIRKVLNECCREENFNEHGATYLTHELVAGLRAKGYVLSAKNDLQALMNNKQTFAVWIQQAVTTQVEIADTTLRLMLSVCNEGSFYNQGAAACTNKLMQQFEKKGYKIDTLTSVTKASLSNRKITYQEWLDLADGIHFSEAKRNARRSVRTKGLARSHEVQVWTLIAETLYKNPEASWKTIKDKLRAKDETQKAVSKLGMKAVKSIFFCVKSLHQAVGFVEEKSFKRYGAYAITNLIVGYLREKGIFVAGNSAVTLRSIRQAKTYSEWRQDIFLLKVSRELTGPPTPQFLVSELRGKKLGAFLFRRVARSRLIAVLIRTLVRKTIGWVAPYALRYWIGKLSPKDGNEDARRVGSMLISAAVLSNCYLNLDYTVLTSILPAVLGVMESQATRSLVEHIFSNANVPRILSRTLLGFAADIEEAVLNAVLTDFLDPQSLNDNVQRWTGVNFNLQQLNSASSLATISSYLQQSVRLHVPIIVENALRVVVEPLAYALSDFGADLSNTFLSVAAKELPSRALSRPPTVHAELVKYYLEAERVMDAEGLKYIYEAFVTAFSDQVLSAMNPLNTDPALIPRSPTEKIIFHTALLPTEGVSNRDMFKTWETQWELETKDYRMQFYTNVQAATYGFVGHLQLQTTISANKISISFFVEGMSSENTDARKILKRLFRRPVLRFAFAETSNRHEGRGVMKVYATEGDLQGQLLVELSTRQKPVITQSFGQVDFVHVLNAPISEYAASNPERITASLSNLTSVFRGINRLNQLQKNSSTFQANNLFPLLLEYEYYTQFFWFSTDFYLVMNSPPHLSAPMQLTVIFQDSRVQCSFAFDHFKHQEEIARLPINLHAPCRTSADIRGTIRTLTAWVTGRAFGRTRGCFRKVEYRREQNKETLLLSWVSRGRLHTMSLPVTALNQPSTELPAKDRKEAMLGRQTVRTLRRVMDSEAATTGSLIFPSVRFSVFTFLASRCVLAGAFRRERSLFGTAALMQNQAEKRAHREQYSLKLNFFKVSKTTTDPSWSLRIRALMQQPKYAQLVEALGSRFEEFVEHLANAYTTWVNQLHVEASRNTGSALNAETLEAMCPDQTRLVACEQRYGMWGSLFFQEPHLPLGRAIARKRMSSPFLFKYWRLGEPASSAKTAIADIEDLEQYKHTAKRTHNIQIVGTLQASISILLSKYKQVLHEEEMGADVRSDHKFQLMKYLHLLMRDVLKEARGPDEEATAASLTSGLRTAGYEVLVRLSLSSSSSPASLEEEKARFAAIEGMAEMLYKDLMLPVRSIHLRSLYSLRVKLYASSVHLPFATKMIRSNPLAMYAGFQLYPTDQTIRMHACKQPSYCPHASLMWNHLYISLLVLTQLVEKKDAVAELLAADSFSQVTGQEQAENSPQHIPVTFEESFIAFKTGLGYMMDMRASIPEAEDFFSSPLSSHSIISLLSAFAAKDKNFRILLLHLPPPEAAAVLSSNHREALQDSTWNAFIALWSFQELFGRLEADVAISMTAFPSFAPPSVLSTGEDSGFWMPQCILDPLQVKIEQLFAPLSSPVARLPVLRKAIDSVLHGVRPQVRRLGYISYSDPQILSLWWSLMNISLEHYSELETEIEAFFRDPENTKNFSTIIQEAATISAFVSQLQMTDTKAVLVRSAKRFGFESWTTLVSGFKTARPSNEAVAAILERVFFLACRMIPANSENRSIAILGYSTEDVAVFRSLIDAITLRLMQLGRQLPEGMTHYPICKAIREASCTELRDIKDATITKSCQELDVVKQVLLARIPFSSPDFCQSMKEAEEPLLERCECSKNSRNYSLLKTFFVDYMTQQLESSAIKDQWSAILKKQFLSSSDPNIFPLAGNALAAIIHEAGMSLAEKDAKTAEQELHDTAVDVYLTMCSFVDYMISAAELKEKNVCSLLLTPPRPLLKLLKRSLEAHIARLHLGRFSLSMPPISTLSLHKILNSKELQIHPASALKVGLLGFITSYYFAKDSGANRQGQTVSSAYQKVQKELANIFNLIADRLGKLRAKFATWQHKVIESLRLLVDYAVKIILNSAKEMTYLSKSTVAAQRADLRIQLRMRQRLQGLPEEAATGGSFATSELEKSSEATTGSIRPASMAEIDEEEQGSSSVSTNESNHHKENDEQQETVASTLRHSPIWKHSSLLQLSSPARVEDKQAKGRGTLGLVKLLVSMLLTDIPRLVSGVVPVVLPNVWFSIAGVLRVKKSVVGSVKDTAEKVCIRVLDSIVLPSLISTNALVPEALIKTQLVLLARNIHFSVMPEGSKVETDLKTAKKNSGFLGMGVLFRGLMFAVAAHLEDLLQDKAFQEKVVKIVHRRVRDLSEVIQMAFKRYLVSEVICQSLEVVIDVTADLLNEKRDDLAHSIFEVVELDSLGRLSVFLEFSVWRLMKLLLDGEGALNVISDIISQVGFIGAAKDTARTIWGWFFGGSKAPASEGE